MATFLVKKPITITRQSGDDCDIVFNIPIIFSLTGVTLRFALFEKNNATRKIFLLKQAPDIIISDQRVEISIHSSDTENKEGTYTWELEALNTSTNKVVTIGFGDFKLIQTLIK